MISTKINLHKLKPKHNFNLIETDFQKIEEPEITLPNRIIFKRGDWFQGWIKLEKIEIGLEEILLLQKTTNTMRVPRRVTGTADIELKVLDYVEKKFPTPENGINGNIKLYKIDVQVGFSKVPDKEDTLKNKEVFVFVSPNTIYEEIQRKYECFQNIQTQNIKIGLVNEDIDSFVRDMKKILLHINLGIDRRLEKFELI